MNARRELNLPKTAFKVVARRHKRNAANHTASSQQPQIPQFYWKNFERAGKSAGLVISLLSLCGILFAAGSKMQRLLDDLDTLHQQVQKHEDRLQQNEANDSQQAAEIGYLKGRMEQESEREPNKSEESRKLDVIEERKETAPAAHPSRRRSTAAASPPSTESNSVPIEDKLYATILYYYNQARRLQPDLAGRLIVICKLDRNGALAGSEVIAASPDLAELAERLTGKIRRWKFPEQVTGLESGGFRKTYFLSPQGF